MKSCFFRHKWSEYYPATCDCLKVMQSTQVRMCLRCKKFESHYLSDLKNVSSETLNEIRSKILDKDPIQTGWLKLK